MIIFATKKRKPNRLKGGRYNYSNMNMGKEETMDNLNVDEIFNQIAEEESRVNISAKVGEQGRILERWENPEIKQVGYNYLQGLLNRVPTELRANAAEVINTLSYYNADIISVTSNDDQISLLLLDDIGLYIDLFHETAEDFIGPHECDYTKNYIGLILNQIGHGQYRLQTLRDAYNDCLIYKRLFRWKDIQRGDIATGNGNILGRRFHSYILSDLFRGERNWNCNFTYGAMVSKLEYSLLPFQVICYECLAYVKEEKDGTDTYCIETKNTLDDVNLDKYSEQTDIAIFSLLSANDTTSEGWTGDTTLRFLGVYNLDKEKSEREKHFAFKQKSIKLSYL